MSFERLIALPRYSRNTLKSILKNDIRAGKSAVPAFGAALTKVWAHRQAIIHFLRTGDERTAFDLRRRFGMSGALSSAPLISTDFFVETPRPCQRTNATIVVPVFNAPLQTAQLFDCLAQTLPPSQAMLVIDDGSCCDDTVSSINRFIAENPSAELIRNTQNLGFVTSVNKAFAAVEKNNHVVLLNTDAIVPDGWLPRLLAPFDIAPNVATVTPLSNNAEILSVPGPSLDFPLDATLVASVDQSARAIAPKTIETPTGVGFCMAINRTFLDALGGFDPAFGRGYGEEVDWCLRTRAQGGRHLVANNLFVGHHGAASFGANQRRKRITRATRTIAKRHPSFVDDILEWERSDPVASERLALAIAWVAAQSSKPVRVFLAHALGGGAEAALQAEVSALLTAGHVAVVVLRVGGPHAWRLEIQGERFFLTGDLSNQTLLEQLLVPLKNRNVIYSCGVGATDPHLLPGLLCQLSQGQRLELRMHDYFPVSPSWNLLAHNGQYEGVPPPTTLDPAHDYTPAKVAHQFWRSAWATAFDQAEKVTVFSASGKAITEEAYPHTKDKIEIVPHPVTSRPRALRHGGRCIGILGGINQAKGGQVLVELAKKSTRRLVVIGELDGLFRLPKPHVVHGRYNTNDIARLARKYDVGVWLIPSIWPETFSFTTHEALATTLPVAVFNLGAQSEAARKAVNGHVLQACPNDTSAISCELEKLFQN